MTLDDHIADLVRKEVARQLAELKPDHDDLLSTRDAAEFLGVHEKTIRRWASAGRLPSQCAGRLLRFKRADLEAALAGNDNTATPEQLAARKYG